MRKLSKIDESVWGGMLDRSVGETTRKEDDIELLDRKGLVNYLKAHYKCVDTVTIIPTIDDNGGNISIRLYEDEHGYWTFLMYEHIDSFRELYVTSGFKESTDYAYNELKNNYTLTEIEDEDPDGHPINNIKIEPKGCRYENLTNKFFLEVLDFIIERIEKPLVKQIEKI